MKVDRKAVARGRERLLDAAEQLFADRGYDGASMRSITRLAGVELGLVNYHFGTKEELYRQVVLRRASVMAAALDTALVGAQAENSLAAIYAAFARTHLLRLHHDEPAWRNYIRLAADIALKGHAGKLAASAADVYQPVFRRYLDAIAAHRPGVARDQLDRIFYIFRMSVLSILVHLGTPREHAEPLGEGEVNAVVESMVGLFASGT